MKQRVALYLLKHILGRRAAQSLLLQYLFQMRFRHAPIPGFQRRLEGHYRVANPSILAYHIHVPATEPRADLLLILRAFLPRLPLRVCLHINREVAAIEIPSHLRGDLPTQLFERHAQRNALKALPLYKRLKSISSLL